MDKTQLVIAIAILLMGTIALAVDSGPLAEAAVVVQRVGPIDAIEGAEHRLGGTDRMFLIEDQWEYNRCALLLPKLPKVNLRSESLLVIMSWKSARRSLRSVEVEDTTLVIRVDQEKPPDVWADSYHPPEFLVFKLPTWPGPVRFELNEEPQFTVLRGQALEERSDELWEEILRIHSGGRGSRNELVRYYKHQWPDSSEQEIRKTLFSNKEKYAYFNAQLLYPMLFHELVDMRAKPLIPRIFELIETMGQHDKAWGPACGAVAGIGGADAVEQCKKQLGSWNMRSRQSAMGILATFGLAETRQIAREQLADLDGGVSGNALILLRHIGIGKEDVPAMIKALEKTEQFYLAPAELRPKMQYFTGETAKGIIYAFGALGPDAKEALPILKRFASDPRLPVPGFQPDAKEAIAKIQAAASSASH